jgi:hypothetical protein
VWRAEPQTRLSDEALDEGERGISDVFRTVIDAQ